MQDDPPMFLVTYTGQHTCSNTSQWIPDVSPPADQCMLSFESDRSSNHGANYWSSPESSSKHPAFWEPSQAASSKNSIMGMSYDAPSVPAAADFAECSPFPITDRPGCSNVVPRTLSPPGRQAPDVDSAMGLLESLAGLCSDREVADK